MKQEMTPQEVVDNLNERIKLLERAEIKNRISNEISQYIIASLVMAQSNIKSLDKVWGIIANPGAINLIDRCNKDFAQHPELKKELEKFIGNEFITWKQLLNEAINIRSPSKDII